MSAGLQLELQSLHSCVDETDADRAREIVGNVAQICLSDVSQRNIGCNRVVLLQGLPRAQVTGARSAFSR